VVWGNCVEILGVIYKELKMLLMLPCRNDKIKKGCRPLCSERAAEVGADMVACSRVGIQWTYSSFTRQATD
jgi:hypothetical protein